MENVIPLINYFKFDSSITIDNSVFATSPVFDILLRVSMGESWPDAILSVLPSRKGAIAKSDETPADDDDAPADNEADEPITGVPNESVENVVPVDLAVANLVEQ